MPETEGYVQSAIKAVTGLASHGERPHRAGDYAFNNIGISSFFMLSSTMPDDLRAEKKYYTVGGCGGNIAWHTENDLIDIADKEILLRDIKVYAQAVLGVANATIVPFDWSATTGEFVATVEKYRKDAGDAFDLAPAAKAAKDLDKAAKKFTRAIKARQGAAGQGQSGDHRARAHSGADQLHPRGALPPRSGGADPAIAGALRRQPRSPRCRRSARASHARN